MRMLRKFNQPYDPTDQELRDWASGEKFQLPQDWELIVPCNSDARQRLILELVIDPASPGRRRRTLLYMLYVITDFFCMVKTKPPEHMHELIDAALAYKDPDVILWAQRSVEVIREPSKFRRKTWMLHARR